MSTLWATIRTALWNLIHRLGLTDIFDILIVAVLLYELMLMMRRTRSSGALKGLLLFFAAAAVSSLLGLTALSWLLMTVLNNGVIVLVILFQPELRTALEHAGRAILSTRGANSQTEEDRIIDEVTQCALDLSTRKVGALIVFEQKTGLNDVIQTGTELNARISAPLLENIFEPNTPLHDGAAVIRDTQIMAAACILRLTENTNISRELGTRHRAAIGITETTDATVLVVSEETGTISVTSGGVITRGLTERDLRRTLHLLYKAPDTNLWSRLRHALRKRKKEKA